MLCSTPLAGLLLSLSGGTRERVNQQRQSEIENFVSQELSSKFCMLCRLYCFISEAHGASLPPWSRDSSRQLIIPRRGISSSPKWSEPRKMGGAVDGVGPMEMLAAELVDLVQVPWDTGSDCLLELAGQIQWMRCWPSKYLDLKSPIPLSGSYSAVWAKQNHQMWFPLAVPSSVVFRNRHHSNWCSNMSLRMLL